MADSVEVLFPDDPEHFLNREEDPLTEAEQELRDLLRNPRRRRERERWALQCLERWRREHPAAPPPEPKARRVGRPAPKPMARWGGVVDEPEVKG